MNNNKECPICLDEYSKNTIKLNCGHSFHLNCINYWKKFNNVCPLCRVRIDKVITIKTKEQILINYILYISILTLIIYLIKSKRITYNLKNNISNASENFMNLINNIRQKIGISCNSKGEKRMLYNLFNNLPKIIYNIIFFKEKIIMIIPSIGSYIRSALMIMPNIGNGFRPILMIIPTIGSYIRLKLMIIPKIGRYIRLALKIIVPASCNRVRAGRTHSRPSMQEQSLCSRSQLPSTHPYQGNGLCRRREAPMPRFHLWMHLMAQLHGRAHHSQELRLPLR